MKAEIEWLHWTDYCAVEDDGVLRRLLKIRVKLSEVKQSGWQFILSSSDEAILDSKSVPVDKEGLWTFGFWVDERRIKQDLHVRLEQNPKSQAIWEQNVPIPQTKSSLPLRLDQLGRNLLEHLKHRESHAVDVFDPDWDKRLRQHDLIYLQPSPDWDEGIPLGNGALGALVCGVRNKMQQFHLDKTDLWFTNKEGKAIGRAFAAALKVKYNQTQSKQKPFFQRLDLARARVETRDGNCQSSAYIHANRNVMCIEIKGANKLQIELERKPVPWGSGGLAWANGSFAYHGPTDAAAFNEANKQRRKILAEIPRMPKSKVEYGSNGDVGWMVHTLPNMSYAVAVMVCRASPVAWTSVNKGFSHFLSCTHNQRDESLQLFVAVVTSHEAEDPLQHALQFLRSAKAESNLSKQHDQWWADFWQRSSIELPDKLEENLWYFGLYQQACCSRSDQATSFFGLWHPLDYRTWKDCYVADAQLEMIWWCCFDSNHLELLYPSHRTFGRLAQKFVEHTLGDGMEVPHMFYPEWAGGEQCFGEKNGHKGSNAWFVLNFWHDYIYSGDEKFLRDVTYPLLRMIADWFVGDLKLEADNLYHCIDSPSPEQVNTDKDNIYDWSLIRAMFRAVLKASEILGVDQDKRSEWSERLDKLFPIPSVNGSLAETVQNPHPYRCHPVVFFGLYPAAEILPGTPEFEAAKRALPMVTRFIGFRFQDRHEAFENFPGGVEPTGFGTGIMAIAAARLGEYQWYRRFLYGLIVRSHMKRNGLRTLNDPRQADIISRASLVEASNAQTAATTKTLIQSWHGKVHLFPCISGGRYTFRNLRAESGLVISAEVLDGCVLWVRVKALHNTRVKLVFPGMKQVESLSLKAGEVWEQGHPNHSVIPSKSRHQPRKILIQETENIGKFLHYPEDLPFGQAACDKYLYLGQPRSFSSKATPPPIPPLLRRADSPKWEDRMEAARFLARYKDNTRAISMLERLCEDSVSLVNHVAAVSLVRMGGSRAKLVVRRLLRRIQNPDFQRELKKAVARYRQKALRKEL